MSRPRGFTDWNPRADALQLVANVQMVLDDYDEQLPLTLRQIFYVLVSRNQIEKTERAYKNQLIEYMGRARRAHLIPMIAIRDDGFRFNTAPGYNTTDNLVDTWIYTANNFTFNRLQDQDRRIVVWCEAQGMVPQLEKVAHDYSIKVASSGGFDSLTSKHDMAEYLSEVPTLVLHIGDHDPSGVHMFSSLDEDITEFTYHYGTTPDFYRLAVTPAHVDMYNLPTAPPKATDRRSFTGQTTQAEALDPRTLALVVRDAIESNIDLNLYQQQWVSREADAREKLMEMITQ